MRHTNRLHHVAIFGTRSRKVKEDVSFSTYMEENEQQLMREGQVWGYTSERRVVASSLRHYSFARGDTGPVMPGIPLIKLHLTQPRNMRAGPFFTEMNLFLLKKSPRKTR